MTEKLVSLLVLLATCAFAQTADKLPPEPNALGVVFWFDREADRLVELPPEQVQVRVSLLSIRTVRVSVESGRAPYRLKTAGPTSFVLALPNADNLSRLGLFRMKSEKSFREVRVLAPKGNPVKGTAGFQQPERVPCDIRQLRTDTYIISPTEPLGPGEYCFISNGEPTSFCFGIDP